MEDRTGGGTVAAMGGTGSLAGRGKRMGCDNSDFSAAHLWAVGRLSYVQAVGCHNVPYVLVTYTV